jgi:hypothetical protein
MKKRYSIASFVLSSCVVLLQTSCVKEDEITDDKEYPEFIVFGTFLTEGSCGTSEACIEIYKADATGLAEDVMDEEPTATEAYPGSYTHNLTPASYQTVMDLFELNPLPEELLALPNGNVGNFNQFGTNFYIEYKTKSGGYQYWILGGSFDGSLSQTIQNYLNVISNAAFFASQG